MDTTTINRKFEIISDFYISTYYGKTYLYVKCGEIYFAVNPNVIHVILSQGLIGKRGYSIGKKRKNSAHETMIVEGYEDMKRKLR